MRASALDKDLLVFVSDIWQTTCTVIRAGEEGFVIDSPIYPEELRALPDVLAKAGFPASGLLATHGDWDHLLGRIAFPEASLGCGESTAARLTAEPGAAQRRLREFDAEHYVERPRPLGLGRIQALPVPGKLELGPTREIELHEAGGHTSDGTAFWLAWIRVLICGDYLSPVEIPMLSESGDAAAYRATLARLEPLVAAADWVVPGHGAPQSGPRALELLAEDAAYLDQLIADPATARPPKSRPGHVQDKIHEANLEQLGRRAPDPS